MGAILALFTAMWNNFFSPDAWMKNIENWCNENHLPYNTSKTFANAVIGYSAVAVGLQTVQIIPNGPVSPDSEHFMIIAFRMYDGANAAITSTNWALGVSDAIAKNGSLTFSNSGSTEMFQFPLRMLIPAAGDSASGLYLLSKPIYWKAQTIFAGQANFSPVVATANYNLGIDLIGLKFI